MCFDPDCGLLLLCAFFFFCRKPLKLICLKVFAFLYNFTFHFNCVLFQKLTGTIEDMDDYGNFFRKSVNDITSQLDINFGSLGRPRRGGRGRGTPGGSSSRQETAKPICVRVRSQFQVQNDNCKYFFCGYFL